MDDLGTCTYPGCGRPAVNTCSHCDTSWCDEMHGAAGCKPMYPVVLPAPSVPIWPDDEAAMDDATFQAMIDDEIADEMAAEFFGDDEAAHVAETVGELHETGRE